MWPGLALTALIATAVFALRRIPGTNACSPLILLILSGMALDHRNKYDPELRALIDEQYQDYITGSESYLNCLNDEAVRARAAYYEVFERYVRYFGVEAGVELDATD